jgi:hypothetical protein
MHDPASRPTGNDQTHQMTRLRVAPGYAPRRYRIVPSAQQAPAYYDIQAGDAIRLFRFSAGRERDNSGTRPQLTLVIRNDAPLLNCAARPWLRVVVRNDNIPRRPVERRLAPTLGRIIHLPVVRQDSTAG